MHEWRTILKAVAFYAAQEAPHPQCVYKSRPYELHDVVTLDREKLSIYPNGWTGVPNITHH